MNEDKIIAWVIYDPATGEIVMQCASRKEARELCAGTNGKIAAVRGSH